MEVRAAEGIQVCVILGSRNLVKLYQDIGINVLGQCDMILCCNKALQLRLKSQVWKVKKSSGLSEQLSERWICTSPVEGLSGYGMIWVVLDAPGRPDWLISHYVCENSCPLSFSEMPVKNHRNICRLLARLLVVIISSRPGFTLISHYIFQYKSV